MPKALKILVIVGIFLAMDAVLPRPGWAPRPLLTGSSLLTAFHLPGRGSSRKKHVAALAFASEDTPDDAVDASDSADDEDDDSVPDHSEDDAAPRSVAIAPTWIPSPLALAPVPSPASPQAPAASAPVKTHRHSRTPFVATVDAGWGDFEARLAELEAGKRKKVRVVQLGDSEIAGDDVTRTLRHQYRRRYGNGGLGFVLAFKPWNWYAREGYDLHSPDDWSVRNFVFGRAANADYGPGGIAFDVAEKGEEARIGLNDPPDDGCRVNFYYEEAPGGGALQVTADDTALGQIATSGPARRPTVKRYDLKECPSELSVKTLSDAHVRIFGWSVETYHPGIVWSSLGVISANAVNLLHYDPGMLAAALKTLQPDLVVLGYGLNIVHVPTMPSRSEKGIFKHVFSIVRHGLPNARCLAVSPYPVAVSEDGTLEPSPSVAVLTRYQREAAAAAGCAFLDRETLAGGPATALKWLEAKPRILSGDYVHLTTLGAEKMGRAMARVLLNEQPEAL